MLIHWPGEKRRHIGHQQYEQLIKPIEIGSIKDLTVYVWNSKVKSERYEKNTKQLGICEKSLEALSIPYVTLGSEYSSKWINLNKIQCGFEALNNVKTEYVLMLDSSDIIVFSNIKNSFEEFKNDKHDVILNADMAHWPKAYPSDFEDKVGRGLFRYLNSGAILGKSEVLFNIYDDLLHLDMYSFKGIDRQLDYCIETDDQIRWKHIYHRYYPAMIVDYYCQYFQTINDINAGLIIETAHASTKCDMANN